MTQNNGQYIFKCFLSVILAMSVLLMMTPVWSRTADSAEIMPLALTAAANFAGGTGTESDPYQIKTPEQMKKLADDVNGGETYSDTYFKLMADIDLGGNENNQWTPIGVGVNDDYFDSPSASYILKFSGTFDGGEHLISGLYIATTDDHQGLFGFVSDGGVIKNLGVDGTISVSNSHVGGVAGEIDSNCTVENCYYIGSISGLGYAGGVVGVNYGSVQNCYNTGDVSGTTYFGGVVGHNRGSVQNCYNTGDVSATGNYVGGVVGCSYRTSLVENCHNTGTVSGPSYIGGVVGRLEDNCTLQNCYNTGTVSYVGSYTYAGGIAGYAVENNTVENCYNTGSIIGSSSNAASVVGYFLRAGTMKNCYFLTGTADYGVSTSSKGTYTPTELTSEQFALQSKFSGFDFSTVWIMSDLLNRPVLRNFLVTVTFDPNGGSGTSKTYNFVNPGNKYGTLPALTTKTGYTLGGWFTEKTGGSEVTSDTACLHANHTIYAQWTANNYKVTLNYQDGRSNDSIIVTYDSTYSGLPATASRTGYTFKEWNTSHDGEGTAVTSSTTVTTASAHTLYAQWTANQYDIIYMDEGGESFSGTHDSGYPTTHTYNTATTLKSATKNGYAFEGWYKTSGCTGTPVTTLGATAYTSDITLYAKWIKLSNTVTFVYQDGVTASTTQEYDPGDPDATYEALPEPSRKGYTFGGWFKDQNCTGGPVKSTDFVENSHTLYAKWTANKYDVTLDCDGGVIDDGDTEFEAEFDGGYGDLPTPKKPGYDFDGWFTEDGTPVTSDTTVSTDGDHTLHAHWSAKQYAVTFDYQGATSGDTDTISKPITFGEQYGGLPTPKKTGYSFGGWFTAENGQGDEITADTEVNIAGDHTLYAHWIECNHKGFVDWHNDGEHHSGTCDNCGKEVSEEHNWQSEVTIPPTVDDEGILHKTCPDCGTETDETIPPHEHVFEGEWKYDEDSHWQECSYDNVKGNQADHSWDNGTVTKEATATEKGEKTYECTVCDATKTEEIPATGGSDDNTGSSSQPSTGTIPPATPSTGDNSDLTDGDTNDPSGDTSEPSTGDNTEPSDGNNTGNVNVDFASGENAPNVTISEETSSKLKEEIIVEHLTPEEKAAVTNGDNLDIILVVEDAGDSVPAADKQAIEAVLTNTEYTLGMHLNIDLIKLINGVEVGKITEISSPIHVTIEIPEELRNVNRAFAIVRVHNGAADILEDVDDDPDTITIVTDKFSTYSIAYQDTKANPNTGVATPFAITGLACAVIVAAVAVKRKKIIE